MTAALRFALLVLGMLLPCLSFAARDIPIIAGTLLQCTVDEPDLSSRTAQRGDPLVCYARPIEEFGCPAFPRGTELAGHFVDYKDPGRLIGKGWMEIEFDRAILPDGEAPITARVVGVRGYHVDRNGHILGKGHAKRDAFEWVLPPLWPVKLATLPRRGPTPQLKGEKLVTLRLLQDLVVPCRGGLDPYRTGWRYFGDSGSNGPALRPFDSSTQWHRFGSDETRSVAQSNDNTRGFRVGGHTVYVKSSQVEP